MGTWADFVKYCAGVGDSWRVLASGGLLTTLLVVLSRTMAVPQWAWVLVLVLTTLIAPYRYCIRLARGRDEALQRASAAPAVQIRDVAENAVVTVNVGSGLPPPSTDPAEQEPGE